jgi:hypothetical protein
MATPEWLTKGSTVYETYSNAVKPVEVTRFTATQVIVKSGENERRYRLRDLRAVGVDFYDSPVLSPPDDPYVLAVQRRQRVAAAMAGLRSVLQDLAQGAQLYKNNFDLAVTMAEQVRDAAQRALDMLAKDREV